MLDNYLLNHGWEPALNHLVNYCFKLALLKNQRSGVLQWVGSPFHALLPQKPFPYLLPTEYDKPQGDNEPLWGKPGKQH